jgi:hypothetical protein
MAIKKTHTFAPKKSDAKKKMEASNSKRKSSTSKQGGKKRFNEFGEEDAM